jgi:putative ABC transport system substrate-binding protein
MSPPELMCSLNRHSLFIVIALIAIPGAAPWSAGDSQAQDAALRRVAFVAMNVDAQSDLASAFRQGLRDAGYAEGRDIYIDWWNGGGDYDHVSEAVADAVRRKADVIVTAGTAVALAAKRQTSKIPIVMALVADPLGSGLVASLARPGGNVTGLSAMVVELSSKRLQLLKEAIPSMARVGIIFNPEAPYNGKVIELLKRAAPELGLTLMFVGIRSAKEFPPAFAELRRSKVDALMVLDDAFMATNEETILSMASKARLPVVLGYTPRSSQGTVISYSPDRRDLFRRAAGYGDKILKGASAADLPIEQPTRFELVVNLRTAKALGLKIPDSLLVQATEVIK